MRPPPSVESLFPLAFPLRGLDVSQPLQKQPPETTPLGTNVRSFEPLTQRGRGGSRPGITRYLPSALPGYVQCLESVVVPGEGALGGINYEVGDSGWTTLALAGTYVLAHSSPGWAVSPPIGVDLSSNMSVGVPYPGTPVGSDGTSTWQLASPVALPAGYQVLSYWQPGAFSLPSGDIQGSHLFPGFGWFLDNFPAGSVGADFGFPTPTTPSFDYPTGSIPEGKFWPWTSGYGEIDISITIQRAYLVAVHIAVFGPADGGSFTAAINGNTLLSQGLGSGLLSFVYTTDLRVSSWAGWTHPFGNYRPPITYSLIPRDYFRLDLPDNAPRTARTTASGGNPQTSYSTVMTVCKFTRIFRSDWTAHFYGDFDINDQLTCHTPPPAGSADATWNFTQEHTFTNPPP